MNGQSLSPEQLWSIKKFDFFEVLAEQETQALAQRMHVAEYRKRETIYFDGDPSDTVYLIRRGKVRLSTLDEQGNRLSLHLLKKGDIFGVMALAGQQKRNWTASAIQKTTLVMIHKDDLFKFQLTNPKLGLKITKLVGKHTLYIENKLQDLMFKGVKERLIHTLSKLAKNHGESKASQITIKITQQELAQLVGATRESVSPALGELEQSGAINREYGKIIIKDKLKLK